MGDGQWHQFPCHSSPSSTRSLPGRRRPRGGGYVFGGLISGGEYNGMFTNDVQRVDLPTGSANVVGHLPFPVAHAMATNMAGHLFVLGGSSPMWTSRADSSLSTLRTTGSHLPGPARAGHRRGCGVHRKGHLHTGRHVDQRPPGEHHDRTPHFWLGAQAEWRSLRGVWMEARSREVERQPIR